MSYQLRRDDSDRPGPKENHDKATSEVNRGMKT